MPLLNICGVTHTRKTFSIASVFLSGEAEKEYAWALSALLAMTVRKGLASPRVIVTDSDLALINALNTCQDLENATHLLCRWHVSKNVLAKCKAYFPKSSQSQVERPASFTVFLKEWERLLGSDYRYIRTTPPGI